MKNIFIKLVGVLVLSGNLAQAQPLMWVGDASPGYGKFSMAVWMYTSMVKIATEVESEENDGFPTNWGTIPNKEQGYTVTYDGEDNNHIACSSRHLNAANGKWICEFSSNKLTDSPLTRRLVSGFIKTYAFSNKVVEYPLGTFTMTASPESFRFAFQYQDSRVEEILCHYALSDSSVSWADCSVQ